MYKIPLRLLSIRLSGGGQRSTWATALGKCLDLQGKDTVGGTGADTCALTTRWSLTSRWSTGGGRTKRSAHVPAAQDSVAAGLGGGRARELVPGSCGQSTFFSWGCRLGTQEASPAQQCREHTGRRTGPVLVSKPDDDSWVTVLGARLRVPPAAEGYLSSHETGEERA